MQLSHTAKSTSAVFDDPNLVGSAGLVPVMRLAAEAGLADLADQVLSVPTDKGANAGVKVTSLVAGMVAGADSIDDMALLRHGGMSRLFSRIYAPSTLGSFLRAFRFGHVRQLDAIAARFLLAVAGLTSLFGRHPAPPAAGERRGYVFVDVDDTVVQVHGHAKQGAGFGYNKVRGLNVLIATVTTPGSAPVIVAQRLRKGACASPRGGKRLVADAVKHQRVGCSIPARRCWCGWTLRASGDARDALRRADRSCRQNQLLHSRLCPPLLPVGIGHHSVRELT